MAIQFTWFAEVHCQSNTSLSLIHVFPVFENTGVWDLEGLW